MSFIFRPWGFVCTAILSLTIHAKGSVVVTDAPAGWKVVTTTDYLPLYGIDFNQDGTPEVQLWAYPGGADVFVGPGSAVGTVSERPGGGGGAGPLQWGDVIGTGISRPGMGWYQGFPVDDRDLAIQLGVGGEMLAYQVDFATELDVSGIASRFDRNGGYLAVQFSLEDGVHYGWVKIDNEGIDSPWGGLITAWAWETEAGKPLVIPEVSSLALAGAGALALASRRRR